MIGWVLLGIIAFIIISLIILKILNRKPEYEVTRMPSDLEESLWEKVKKACCTRKR